VVSGFAMMKMSTNYFLTPEILALAITADLLCVLTIIQKNIRENGKLVKNVWMILDMKLKCISGMGLMNTILKN